MITRRELLDGAFTAVATIVATSRAVTAALPANVNKASVSIDFEHGKSDVAIVVHATETLTHKQAHDLADLILRQALQPVEILNVNVVSKPTDHFMKDCGRMR